MNDSFAVINICPKATGTAWWLLMLFHTKGSFVGGGGLSVAEWLKDWAGWRNNNYSVFILHFLFHVFFIFVWCEDSNQDLWFLSLALTSCHPHGTRPYSTQTWKGIKQQKMNDWISAAVMDAGFVLYDQWSRCSSDSWALGGRAAWLSLCGFV